MKETTRRSIAIWAVGIIIFILVAVYLRDNQIIDKSLDINCWEVITSNNNFTDMVNAKSWWRVNMWSWLKTFVVNWYVEPNDTVCQSIDKNGWYKKDEYLRQRQNYLFIN